MYEWSDISHQLKNVTHVLYLENYEEMRNLVFTSKKNVILTPKNIFLENRFLEFSRKE